MKKIVVIEDDKTLRRALAGLLEENGYQVFCVEDFLHAEEGIKEAEPDLVLLDIILPGTNGQEILRNLRKTSDLPVIMLTSKTGETDEILSMSYGADDYMTKPYNPALLLLKIEALFRRIQPQREKEELEYAGMRLNLLRSTLAYEERAVILSKNEMSVLHYLMKHQGNIVSRDELMDYLWDCNAFVDDNTLTVNINRLRKRMEEVGISGRDRNQERAGIYTDMNFKNYIKDHWFVLGIQLGTMAVLQGVCLLFCTPFALQVFLFWAQCLSGAGILFCDYKRKQRFYTQMKNQQKNLKEKYLLMEMLEEPEFLEGQIFCQTMREMQKSMNDEIFGQIRRNNAFKRYVETWVHEVKLPISSIRLMLHEYRGESGRALKEQISRIESHVEQVLYYLRSEVPEKDYLIQKYSLKELTDRTIAEHKDSLILNHIKVIQNTQEAVVCTDGKWLQFMLGQILSNAVKYKKEKEACIEFWSEQGEHWVKLHVRDNGLGIPRQDLPKVFEKSFTGENGRKGQASTGMGLYLCKTLCERLGHSLELESEEGVYTELILTFMENSFIELL